jgi:hypothetical protein
MPLWETLPTSAEPVLSMSSWRVFELADGDRHLVGVNERNLEGRVSSAVEQLDVSTLVCRTGTGRLYRLVGRPGAHSDASYVWQYWVEREGVTSWTEVTADVWAAHIAAKLAAERAGEA